MSKLWSYLRQLVGNGKAATIGIGLFILILCVMFYHKALSAEIDIAAGTSFGTAGAGPVLGLNFTKEIQAGLNFTAGTDLWGSTQYNATTVPNNWDWHAGLEGCKWFVCAGIGPAFVQRVDAINGAHTDYYLGIKFKLSERLWLVAGHISDAGTTSPNIGRQAIMLSYRLQ